MRKFFILATKRVELRGFILANTVKEAKEKVKENWQVFDRPHNTITANTIEPDGDDPIISEFDEAIKIVHIEDDKGYKHPRGIELTKLQKRGKWK